MVSQYYVHMSEIHFFLNKIKLLNSSFVIYELFKDIRFTLIGQIHPLNMRRSSKVTRLSLLIPLFPRKKGNKDHPTFSTCQLDLNCSNNRESHPREAEESSDCIIK